jgi:hypothetical protein
VQVGLCEWFATKVFVHLLANRSRKKSINARKTFVCKLFAEKINKNSVFTQKLIALMFDLLLSILLDRHFSIVALS